ncbi:peptidoglycan editing factor PgeF [Shewanella cyperi]|uniref:peptidoglycan editing factor PgeF n=1 Tax=Shewanella cyperi TaxID=2814292 RepID=UPI001A94CBCF|nr:peptidoglycan editing factor PgeF [Shewanella cyperi]QSX39949.1 peptidoglycan editing factor PgeF [Shewanella cyperi]
MFRPDWPTPAGVHIAMTDRHGGVSAAPFDSLNLGLHVGDDEAKVLANRALLCESLALPSEPVWLEQVHGTRVLDLALVTDTDSKQADASYSNQAGKVCVVMTADCLPVLLTSDDGQEIAAVHAGWRGLCDGVIEAAVARFHAKGKNITAYLGPAIGPDAFEVGAEVRLAFLEQDSDCGDCFRPHGAGKYLADLYRLADRRLRALGVEWQFHARQCTFRQTGYFSYRRDGVTGRMASLIWRD